METKMNENQEENFQLLQPTDTEQGYLESLYGGPLMLLSPKNQADIIFWVSEVLGSDGEIEVKRLIFENRLPIMVGPEGNWYTDLYPDENLVPVERLVRSAVADYKRHMKIMPDESPKYLLRECLACLVDKKKDWLIRLREQLLEGGEHSRVLQRQIDWLNKLNTALPFSREELSEILN